MSPSELLIVWKPGAVLGEKIEGKMEEGNFLSPGTIDWMVFLPQHELLK